MNRHKQALQWLQGGKELPYALGKKKEAAGVCLLLPHRHYFSNRRPTLFLTLVSVLFAM